MSRYNQRNAPVGPGSRTGDMRPITLANQTNQQEGFRTFFQDFIGPRGKQPEIYL